MQNSPDEARDCRVVLPSWQAMHASADEKPEATITIAVLTTAASTHIMLCGIARQTNNEATEPCLLRFGVCA
jgi:hypothetical protein